MSSLFVMSLVAEEKEEANKGKIEKSTADRLSGDR